MGYKSDKLRNTKLKTDFEMTKVEKLNCHAAVGTKTLLCLAELQDHGFWIVKHEKSSKNNDHNIQCLQGCVTVQSGISIPVF